MRALITAHDSNPEIFADQEQGLVDTVNGLNVIDCGRVVNYWRRLVNEDGFEADQAKLHARRRLHLSQTLEGMWRLDGWLDPEAGEVIRTALDAATPPPS